MRQSLAACAIFVSVLSCGMFGVAHAQAPPCGPVLTRDCLYFPATEFSFVPTSGKTTYVDRANLKRAIAFAVRTPIGAPVPMPVMIWSHGGAEGKNDPENSLPAWSDVTAAAGYLTISIAHTPRLDRPALCQAIGITDAATCDLFKPLNWDRPFDISAVINELERMNREGDLRGKIDLTRIAVGGHSAGAGATLTIAGALRNFTGAPLSFADKRPVAFLAFSPQQPGTEGFFDTDFKRALHSWAPISKPVLIGTGDGDSTCNPGEEPGSCPGDTPFGRRLNFDRMGSSGNKYRIYVHDADAFHTLFAMNTNKCAEVGVDQAKCDETGRWLQSAALAFLDGHVRQDRLAQQWLKSNNVGVASKGVAEWSRK
jgi:hypothetical protein